MYIMKASSVEKHGVRAPSDPYSAHRLLVSLVPHMVGIARHAANTQAFSYRGLHVGVAGLFLEADQSLSVLSAANVKSKSSKEKVCAEKQVLKKAVKHGATETIGLVVAGPDDIHLIKGITGRESPTLHCCSDCLESFTDHSLVHGDTTIVTAGLTKDTFQAHTVEQMQSLYRGDDDSEAPAHSLRSPWEQREMMFDFMVRAEEVARPEVQRSPARLGQMALSARI